jgi:hypothetical protein
MHVLLRNGSLGLGFNGSMVVSGIKLDAYLDLLETRVGSAGSHATLFSPSVCNFDTTRNSLGIVAELPSFTTS